MNYSSLQHIHNLIDKGCSYWRVTDTADRQLLALNETVTDTEASKEMLNDVLGELQGNAVKITLSAKTAAEKAIGGSKNEKANYTIFYKLATSGGAIDTNTTAKSLGGGFDSNKLLELILLQSNQLADLKQQLVTETLSAKFELFKLEMKAKETDPDTGGNDRLMQTLYSDVKTFIMAKEGILSAAPKTISGGPQKGPQMQAVKTPANASEANEILNDTITTLAKADPEILTHLQQLAELAVNDPGTYAAAVQSLSALSNTGTNG